MRLRRKDLKKEESHEAAILICQVEKALPLPIITSTLPNSSREETCSSETGSPKKGSLKRSGKQAISTY